MEYAKPDSVTFWNHYYRYPLSTSSTWRKVGGNLLLAHLRDLLKPNGTRVYYNSCALRVSIGLHYCQPIPRNTPGANRCIDSEIQGNETLTDEDGYVFSGRVPANIRGRFILSSTAMTSYLAKTWGTGESINTREELQKFESSLDNNKTGIFARVGHTGVIKKGYKDPYIESYFPVTAWRLS